MYTSLHRSRCIPHCIVVYHIADVYVYDIVYHIADVYVYDIVYHIADVYHIAYHIASFQMHRSLYTSLTRRLCCQILTGYISNFHSMVKPLHELKNRSC